jgi:hypothetical protein
LVVHAQSVGALFVGLLSFFALAVGAAALRVGRCALRFFEAALLFGASCFGALLLRGGLAPALGVLDGLARCRLALALFVLRTLAVGAAALVCERAALVLGEALAFLR